MTKHDSRKNQSVLYLSASQHLHLATLWDIFRDAIDNYQENGDVNQAAAIALYAILSIIPLIILSLIVATHFFSTSPEFQYSIIEGLQDLHPSFSGDLLKQLGQIDAKKNVLGWVGIISLVWFSSAIFGAIETAFNIIFRSPVGRNYFLSKLIAVAMIPMGWAIGIAGVAITYVGRVVAEIPFFDDEGFFLFVMVRSVVFLYGFPYLLMVLFFTVVYKLIPTKKVSLTEAVITSAIFSALMEVAKQFFAWYIANYTRYNIIFGSLEAVVILVIWVFYMALILLFCAELISSYQRRNLILLERAFLKPKKDSMRVDERLFRKFGKLYNAGDYVFREGDGGSEMYYILSGRVRMEKQAGRIRKALAQMGPGNFFGEMAALIGQPRTASAYVVEASSIAAVNGDIFRDLLRGSEEMSLFMLKEFSHRITHTNASLEECTQALIRLTVVLYFLKEWPLKDEGTPLADLAGRTGKTVPEILEVLVELAKQGVLTLDGDRVTGFSHEQAWRLWGEQGLI